MKRRDLPLFELLSWLFVALAHERHGHYNYTFTLLKSSIPTVEHGQQIMFWIQNLFQNAEASTFRPLDALLSQGMHVITNRELRLLEATVSTVKRDCH